jgi:photosystem II stability/assembly factor-like uncharacterized protein
MIPGEVQREMRIRPVILFVAALTACAAPAMLTSESRLGVTEGVVVLRLVSNMEFPDWRSITVKSDTGAESYDLHAVPYAERGSYVFAAAVPEGRYTAHDMYAHYFAGSSETGTTELKVTAPIASRTGAFRVAAGRVTNLGTWVYQPGPRLNEKEFQFLLAIDATPAPTKDLFAMAFPNLAEAVRAKPELGWEAAQPIPHRAEIIAAAKRAVIGLNSPVVTRSGVMYAGARMGQVRVRPNLSSDWRTLDTGSLHEILCVLPFADGRILAGGEEGFVAYSPDAGRTWQHVSLVRPNAIVTFLGMAPNHSLYLVAETEREVVVYTSEQPASGWRELRRISQPAEDTGNIWIGPKPWKKQRTMGGATLRSELVAISSARLVVVQQPNTIWSYEFASGRWEASAPAPIGIFSVEASSDGYVWAIPVSGLKMSGTGDWGRTWTPLEYFAHHVTPAFANRSTGYMAALPYGLAQTWRLMKTTDGGSSWSSLGQIPDFQPERFVVDPSGKLIAVTPAHQLYVSGDDGRSWTGPR